MEQTTARLRKTFRYPAEADEEDDIPEALDEEEQETLITTLTASNQATNRLYTNILIALPTLSLIPYLPSLFHSATAFLSLLSITSLLSTIWLLTSLPPTKTGISFLDSLNTSSQNSKGTTTARGLGVDDDGPVKQYLPYLNLGLCTVLSILGTLVARKGGAGTWYGFGWLPGLIYVVVLLAKSMMGSVDPEVELSSLRYGFKGA